MEPKHNIKFIIKNLVFVLAIVLFSRQAFCGDPNATSAPQKTQVQKQTQKQTAPVKTQKPAKSPLSFRPEMPLREAIDILRNSTVPPLNIVVMWKDLDENADITGDTPIGINGVSGVSLKTCINLLLMSLSAGGLADLGYTIDSGVIIIATKDSLPKKMNTRVYDISDVAAPPSMGGLMGGIGMNMGGIGMNMGGMPYGNMMPYGMMPYGTNNMLSGFNQYLNPGYPSQGYMNYGYPNQGYMNPAYPNQGYLNQGYPNQGIMPYNNFNRPSGIGMVPRF
jgi:hypothetical protein